MRVSVTEGGRCVATVIIIEVVGRLGALPCVCVSSSEGRQYLLIVDDDEAVWEGGGGNSGSAGGRGSVGGLCCLIASIPTGPLPHLPTTHTHLPL